MKRVHFLLKKALTPITIMVIPHENLKSINVKVPSLAIFLVLLLSLAGSYYVLSLAANGLQYPYLVKKLDFYSDQFSQWNATVSGPEGSGGGFPPDFFGEEQRKGTREDGRPLQRFDRHPEPHEGLAGGGGERG